MTNTIPDVSINIEIQPRAPIIVGVDTHADTHHVALINEYGKRLSDKKFVATEDGYRDIVSYITAAGLATAIGVEGAGSYGAGLARHLTTAGFTVVEVNRPNRAERRLHGKSDPLDAYQAAQSTLAHRGTSTPKSRDGYVEALRVLRTARNSAVKAHSVTQVQIRSVLVTAPSALREKYRGHAFSAHIAAMAATRPSGPAADPVTATALTLRRLARRHEFLSEEIAACNAELAAIIQAFAPQLTQISGVGTAIASQLLITVGDNPERITNEAQFAALVGVAPIPASSGKTTRHRLSRGGDRAANSAIYHVALVRMATNQRTKDYVAKRTLEGKSKRDILRCLKRYIARELYHALLNPQPLLQTDDLALRRIAHGITQRDAAQQLGVWNSAIFRIEKGRSSNREIIHKYRQWLDKQPRNET